MLKSNYSDAFLFCFVFFTLCFTSVAAISKYTKKEYSGQLWISNYSRNKQQQKKQRQKMKQKSHSSS